MQSFTLLFVVIYVFTMQFLPGNSLTDFLEHPAYVKRFIAQANPLRWIGRTDELRGVLAWLQGERREFLLHREQVSILPYSRD